MNVVMKKENQTTTKSCKNTQVQTIKRGVLVSATAGQLSMTIGGKIQRRYPRLIRSMCCDGRLRKTEAIRALVEYQTFGIREGFASEAVTRMGGQLAAIRQGIQYRHFTSLNI